MPSIENKRNWDDVFLRDVTVALLNELNDKIFWYSRWENEERKIPVPIYYSMTGDDKFLMDAFVDDIPGKRIEMNYDAIPRGILTLETPTINSSEITNPHVRVSRNVEDTDGSLKRFVSKIRSLPMTIGYSLTIRVASEGDLFKCQQAIWEWIYQYEYFDFEFNFLRIDAFFKLPDEFQTKIERITNMGSDVYMDLTVRIDIKTFFPLFGKNEKLPPIKRVQFQANYWRLAGSGADQKPSDNQYPSRANGIRSGDDRKDRIPNPNDGLPE